MTAMASSCSTSRSSKGSAAANRYGILYSAYVVTARDGARTNQFHVPCSKDLLGCFDYSKLGPLGITYVFRKSEDNAFNAYYQGNAARPGERFLMQFVGNGYPPEKYYIPVGTRQLIGSLGKRELAELALQAIPELARRLVRRLGF